jgi:hypothetical protein
MDPENDVRYAAVQSLRRIWQRCTNCGFWLDAALKDQSEEYVIRQLILLGSLARMTKAQVPVLLKALTDRNSSLRKGGSVALGKTKVADMGVTDALLALVHDQSNT